MKHKFPFTFGVWKKFLKFMNWDAPDIPAEAIEYQPDALEIANERLPLWARYSVVFAFIFLTGALVWATLGKVDVIVTGNGKVVSDKQTESCLRSRDVVTFRYGLRRRLSPQIHCHAS